MGLEGPAGVVRLRLGEADEARPVDLAVVSAALVDGDPRLRAAGGQLGARLDGRLAGRGVARYRRRPGCPRSGCPPSVRFGGAGGGRSARGDAGFSTAPARRRPPVAPASSSCSVVTGLAGAWATTGAGGGPRASRRPRAAGPALDRRCLRGAGPRCSRRSAWWPAARPWRRRRRRGGLHRIRRGDGRAVLEGVIVRAAVALAVVGLQPGRAEALASSRALFEPPASRCRSPGRRATTSARPGGKASDRRARRR